MSKYSFDDDGEQKRYFAPAEMDDHEAMIEHKGGRRSVVKDVMANGVVRTFGVAVACFTCFLWLMGASKTSNGAKRWSEVTPFRVSLPHHYDGVYTQNDVNATLGFEKILVLNLPHRLDKKDELLMMAEVQGLDLTFVDTRMYDQLDKKGLMWHKGFEDQPGTVGTYRAHMDAWQKMLQEGWSSALILEDDSDWDVDLVHALQQLHQPFATLVSSFNPKHSSGSIKSTKHDPWLTPEWDVLNLGPCIEDPFQDGDRKADQIDPLRPPHILYDDKTVADREQTHDRQVNYFATYNYVIPSQFDDAATVAPRKRMVTVSNRPICMNAYAVSRKGALKLLHHYSREMTMPVDVQMAALSTKSQILSYSVLPPIMGQWKTQDGGARNSDNFLSLETGPYKQEDAKVNHNPSVGFSVSIQNSLHAALPKIIERM